MHRGSGPWRRGFAEHDIAVVSVGIVAGVIGVGHDADRDDFAGRFAEGALVVLDDIARDLLPGAEFVASRFGDDHLDAGSVAIGNHGLARCAVLPDVHQRGIGQLLAGQHADVVEKQAVVQFKLVDVPGETDYQPHR